MNVWLCGRISRGEQESPQSKRLICCSQWTAFGETQILLMHLHRTMTVPLAPCDVCAPVTRRDILLKRALKWQLMTPVSLEYRTGKNGGAAVHDWYMHAADHTFVWSDELIIIFVCSRRDCQLPWAFMKRQPTPPRCERHESRATNGHGRCGTDKSSFRLRVTRATSVMDVSRIYPPLMVIMVVYLVVSHCIALSAIYISFSLTANLSDSFY